MDLGIMQARIGLDGGVDYIKTLKEANMLNNQFEQTGAKAFSGVSAEAESLALNIRSTLFQVLGVAGITGLFYKASEGAMQLEEAFTKLGVITDDIDVAKLTEDLAKFDTSLGTTTDLVNAFTFAVKTMKLEADQTQMTQFTETMMKLGDVIGVDAKSAIESISKVMTAYNMKIGDAQKVSDTLFTAYKQGSVDGNSLVYMMERLSVTASTLNIPFNELASVFTTLTRTMTSTEAFIGLRSVLMSLNDPSKEAKEALKGIGIESVQTVLKTKGLIEVIGQISEKAGDNTDVLTKIFGDGRTFRAVASLVGEQGKSLQETMGKIADSTGSVNKAFDLLNTTAKDTLAGSMNELKNSLAKLGQELLPLIKAFSSFVSAVADVAGNMSDTQKVFILYVAGLKLATSQMVKMTSMAVANTTALGINTGSVMANKKAWDAWLLTSMSRGSATTLSKPLLDMSQAYKSNYEWAGTSAKANEAYFRNVQAQASLASKSTVFSMNAIKDSVVGTAGALTGGAGATGVGLLSALGNLAVLAGTAWAGWEVGKVLGDLLKLEDGFAKLLFNLDEVEKKNSELGSKASGQEKGILDKWVKELKGTTYEKESETIVDKFLGSSEEEKRKISERMREMINAVRDGMDEMSAEQAKKSQELERKTIKEKMWQKALGYQGAQALNLSALPQEMLDSISKEFDKLTGVENAIFNPAEQEANLTKMIQALQTVQRKASEELEKSSNKFGSDITNTLEVGLAKIEQGNIEGEFRGPGGELMKQKVAEANLYEETLYDIQKRMEKTYQEFIDAEKTADKENMKWKIDQYNKLKQMKESIEEKKKTAEEEITKLGGPSISQRVEKAGGLEGIRAKILEGEAGKKYLSQAGLQKEFSTLSVGQRERYQALVGKYQAQGEGVDQAKSLAMMQTLTEISKANKEAGGNDVRMVNLLTELNDYFKKGGQIALYKENM